MKTTPKFISLLLIIISLAIGIFTNIATDVIPDSLKSLSRYSWLALGILIIVYLFLNWLSMPDEQIRNKNISQLARREINKATLQISLTSLKKALLDIWISKLQIRDIISILSRIASVTAITSINLRDEIWITMATNEARKKVVSLLETTKRYEYAKTEIDKERQAGNISLETATIAISNLDKELDEKIDAIVQSS
jgi:hypothetical protein